MNPKPTTTAGNDTEPVLAWWSATVPVAMGYVPLGAVFGFLFVQAGGAAWLAVLTSLVVYAGAAQYMMIPMVAAGLPWGAIALATLVVNLRHAFYGLSLLDRWPTQGWARWYAVFGLTDETYSVLTTLPAHTPTRHWVGITALNQGWWVLGTSLGAWLGAQATVSWQGLDFALVSLFAVLAVEQWRRRTSAVPMWLALGTYGVAYPLSPGNALVLSIAACVIAAVVWQPKEASHG